GRGSRAGSTRGGRPDAGNGATRRRERLNVGRAVAVIAGMDHLPGVTVNRYCSSSLQTTRMAMHAIRAGEGHVFISAGVETVSRAARGTADNPPVDPSADPRSRAGNPWTNVIFERAQGESAARAAGGTGVWHDPRQ